MLRRILRFHQISIFILIFIFASLGLQCFIAVPRLLLVVASGNCSLLQCMGFSLLWPLVVEQRLQQLWHVGCGCCSQAPGHRLDSCGGPAELLHSMRDFPSQGSKPCLLQWQADSLPLSLQGSPLSLFFS